MKQHKEDKKHDEMMAVVKATAAYLKWYDDPDRIQQNKEPMVGGMREALANLGEYPSVSRNDTTGEPG